MDLEGIANGVLEEYEEWLCSEIENWPAQGCFDTCATIEDDLRQALPSLNLRLKGTRFYDPAWQEWCQGHTWLQGKDGTIIDPTIGQFVGGSPLRVFPRKSPFLDLYAAKISYADEHTHQRLCRLLRKICTSDSCWYSRL